MKRYLPLILSLGVFCQATIADTGQAIEFAVGQFDIHGNNPLEAAETTRLLSGFTHKKHTLASLRNVASTLEKHLHERGYAFYRVILPPQTLDQAGTIRLDLQALRVEDIAVEGNRHFSRDNILASLPPLRLHQTPDNDRLATAIKLANQHPHKQISLTFHPLEKSEHPGARIAVKDTSPHEFLWMMNTRGSAQTGDFRMMGAYQYSNLFGLDHIINVNYTLSPDHFDEVRQYGASYQLPLYRVGGWLSGYYARSDVDAGTVGGLFDISGSGEMGGVHYRQALPRWHRYEHTLEAGFDDKHFNNDVIYGRVQNVGTDVRSRPFSLTYRGQFGLDGLRAGWDIGWAGNLGGGDDNHRLAYDATRKGARPDWNVVRLGAYWDIGLPLDFTWRNAISGQYSSDLLIPAEQLGLGGLTTVRGYREREAGGDSGHLLKTELWTPELLPGLHALVFYDQGHIELQRATTGEKPVTWLRSTGLGARWQWQQKLSLSVDLAHAFDRGYQTQPGSGRVHAQLMYRF
ncbi:ShlB/FhaC/HecB family hemolysin secretion/activation protein [Candidatus Woesearchaeota archaeon]|nr:ShlB/FhaC/HecB family hemolysin secretion/activation protein [Candidatus Woesearchaeota archaeon]